MSAIFNPFNMQIRNEKYHYRRRIPSDLVHLFGRKEVTKSLRTSRPIDAVRLKNRLDGQLEQLFQACRLEVATAEISLARLYAILEGKPQPQTPPTTESAPIVIIPSRRRGKRLSDAVDAYCKEQQNGWSAKTAKEFAGIYDRLIKGLSDPWLQDIDRPALVAFRDKLSLEGKHAKTVNKYLQILSTVLRYAGRLKWMQGNPAEGLGLKDSRREDEIRRAFTLEEISKIFMALQSSKNSFYQADHHERYWLPLLGIYTGARVNELAQLTVADVIIDHGIPAINITSVGGEGKRVKSESARRAIPLHDDLLTLGFLVYVRNTKTNGYDRLFPALKLGPNGYSHYFVARHFSGSNGWLRGVLPDLEPGVSFHSFRHIVTTMLKNAETSERLIEEILGHKHTSLAMGRYGKPYDLSIKRTAINKIVYKIVPDIKIKKRLMRSQDEEVYEVELLVSGDIEIPYEFDLDNQRDQKELLQYERPDLYGYSIFHKAIPHFQPDAVFTPAPQQLQTTSSD